VRLGIEAPPEVLVLRDELETRAPDRARQGSESAD
jgi:sRNA-binding carbon storage regulator CsrA